MKLAQKVLAQSIHDNTRSSYRSATNHLIAFHKRIDAPFTFPVSPDTLCLWIADSAAKLRFPSIRVYLHGVATIQVEMGYPNPIKESPLVWRMFRAVKRLQGDSVRRQRLPITVSILSKITPLLNTDDLNDLCTRAAMWLGTCGLLRSGEFTRKPSGNPSPQIQHLTFYDEDNKVVDIKDFNHHAVTHMRLLIPASKTDPFRTGVIVTVGNPTAIRYMQIYLLKRPASLARLPLLAGPDGQPLTTSALVRATQSLIERAGIPDAHLFLGHSFRKGGATSLHEAGNPDSLIRTMGRWASFAFATYVETPLLMLIKAGQSMTNNIDQQASQPLAQSFWDSLE